MAAFNTIIPTQNILSSPTLSGGKKNKGAIIRCLKVTRRLGVIANNNSGNDAVTAATDVDEESFPPIELPPGPPSIISALNVEKALLGIAITDIDHYGRLGVSRKCSYDEVAVAYKKKVEEAMNEGLEEVDVNKKLDLLKESYSILSTREERRLYDWSLVRSEEPYNYKWPFEVDQSVISTGTPPPQEPEDVEPTKWVGYFFLGWFLLSAVLSVAFNR